ncbi:hypothetical protein LAT59_04675 [Candidatus Gracilibacteria bacterium]|nr:hypothetical protein [Candidatus Gracilibacteria bacterium]
MRQDTNNIVGFTLTELLVSITISVMILGGVFYFISETLLGLARSSSQSEFLKSFYTFSSILDSGDFEIISNDGYHIGLLESPNTGEGIIIGVIDATNLRLITPMEQSLYLPSAIAYRAMSEDEITAVRSNLNSVYNLEFLQDGVFDNFYVNVFEFTPYNSEDIYELILEVFPR